MTSDEEDREVLSFDDVAEEMYSTEVTQQCSPPLPEVAGVRPPDDKEERLMSVAEWVSRGLAMNSLPEKYVPGLSLDGLTRIMEETRTKRPGVFAQFKEDLEHFKQVVAENPAFLSSTNGSRINLLLAPFSIRLWKTPR